MLLLAGSTSVYAQVADPLATSTPTETPAPQEITPAEPAFFPSFPLATTSEPVAPAATSSVPVVSPGSSTDLPPASKPVQKKIKAYSAPVIKNIEPAATSTPTTTIVFSPLPLLTAKSSGDVYTYIRHAPLNKETTQILFGIASISALMGFLLVQKQLLTRAQLGVARFFSSTRSLPHPQAEG